MTKVVKFLISLVVLAGLSACVDNGGGPIATWPHCEGSVTETGVHFYGDCFYVGGNVEKVRVNFNQAIVFGPGHSNSTFVVPFGSCVRKIGESRYDIERCDSEPPANCQTDLENGSIVYYESCFPVRVGPQCKRVTTYSPVDNSRDKVEIGGYPDFTFGECIDVTGGWG